MRTLALALLLTVSTLDVSAADLVVDFGGPGTKRWVSVLALSGPAGDSAATRVGDGDHRATFVKMVDAPLLVCAGGEGRATDCRVVLPGSATVQEFALAAGRHVRGRCFVGRDPVRGAEVRLLLDGVESRIPYAVPLSGDSGAPAYGVRTSVDGTFAVPHLRPGRYLFEIHLPGGRVELTDAVDIPPAKTRDDGTVENDVVELADFRIAQGVDVVVDVTTSAGQPVHDAVVGIAQEQPGSDRITTIEGRTNDDGAATLRGVDPSLPLRVTCAAKPFLRWSRKFDAPPPVVNCVMRRFAAVTAVVQNAEGEPLSNASARLGESAASADATGRLTLENLRPGEQAVRVSAPGHRARLVELTLAEGERNDAGTIVLESGETMNGTVVDAASREPIAGAQLRVVAPASGASTTSDEDGRFSLAVDPAGREEVEVTAAGYGAARRVAEKGDVVVALSRPGSLQVMAWNEEGDAPCSGCTIDVSGDGLSFVQTTNGAGTTTFESIPAGTYYVTRERARGTGTIVRVSGGDTYARAEVEPRKTTRVELGSEAATVRVVPRQNIGAGWQLEVTSASMSRTVSADASGTYLVRKRPGETCRLALLQHESGTRIGTLPAKVDGGVYALPVPSGELALRALRGDRAAAGVMVKLVAPDSATVAWSRTGANGVAILSHLPAGVYTLHVEGGDAVPVSITADSRVDLGTIDVTAR